jgi:nucleotide-binding universal stress UspA family protein
MIVILVPLDGSALAERALPAAASLVRRLDGRLELLRVQTSTGRSDAAHRTVAATTADRAPEPAKDYITRSAREVGERYGIRVDHYVADGDVAEVICTRVAASGANLVAMASHRRSRIARLLGGGVVHRVVRCAHTPVLVLPASAAGDRQAFPSCFDRILIVDDGSPPARGATEAALALIDRGVSELHLLDVVRPVRRSSLGGVPAVRRVDGNETARIARRISTTLGVATESLERAGCDVFPHVRIDDDVARAILRLASGFNVTLIAIGTDRREPTRPSVDDVADQVMRRGRYPMLIVPAPAAGHQSAGTTIKEA